MNYWLFQANAEYFDLPRALRSTSTITWIITRYNKLISEGDIVLLWLSGPRAGIYGIGHIKLFVTASSDRDTTFWLDKTDQSYVGKQHAIVQVDHAFAEAPFLKAEIRQISGLSSLSVLKAPIGTNFKVTPDEWKLLRSKLKSRMSTKSTSLTK